ncbi:unnamed protein product [Lathyrus oleraceus]
MDLKLDMSKTCDMIEWSFITRVLEAMGFSNALVHLIRKCITSVSYQIFINGQPRKIASPKSRLRQGDPLSHYLFILCENVLLGLFKKEPEAKNIHGIQVVRKEPQVSPMFFCR